MPTSKSLLAVTLCLFVLLKSSGAVVMSSSRNPDGSVRYTTVTNDGTVLDSGQSIFGSSATTSLPGGTFMSSQQVNPVFFWPYGFWNPIYFPGASSNVLVTP
eukprot:GILJ01022847.1.p1 GENE.GILJ01022847.1~~GILJ01022847.1.p1  ORF type:complete len:102 (+),score=11.41 GILJ01022847.1:131-436(+)